MQKDRENKPRLLATEDNLEEQKFLQFYLRRNFEVDIADSSEAFLEKYQESNYDILMFDISIRGPKTGIDLIKEVRAAEKGKEIPVVVHTAHAYLGEKKEAIEAGADLFLVKPVPRDELMGNLLKICEEKVGLTP
ncbi:MAG: response regulator [Rhodothermaceae bacterium]